MPFPLSIEITIVRDLNREFSAQTQEADMGEIITAILLIVWLGATIRTIKNHRGGW